MSRRSSADPRAVSPAVGVVLLVGIAVLLVTVTGVMVFDLAETEERAPQARLSVASTDAACSFVLEHEAGERIDGDRLRIQGLEDPRSVAGATLTAGDAVEIDPVDDELTVLWFAAEADTSHTLARFEVNASPTGSFWSCAPGTLYTGDGGGLKVVTGDGGRVIDMSATSNLAGLGPADADITGDGTRDVPFVTSSGAIKVTNATNGTTTLATDADVPNGSIGYDKTRLGVGSWNGSGPSVFFVDQNHDAIYRVDGSGTVVKVATPGDGAQAVAGTGDVDGDGTDELVFADASQTVQYVDTDGSVTPIPNGGAGSNNGIGAGGLHDFDGDGVASVVLVDGSNQIVVTGDAESTTTFSPDVSKKSPVTVADVDGDGAGEIVYLNASSGEFEYVDDVRGSNTIEVLRDEDGSPVTGDDDTGVT